MIKFKTKNNEKYIDARSVHSEIGIKTKFTDWIRRRLSKCNFKTNSYIKEEEDGLTNFYFKNEDMLKIIDLDKSNYDIKNVLDNINKVKSCENKSKSSILDSYKNLFNKILDNKNDVEDYALSTAYELEIDMLKNEIFKLSEENSKLKHEINVFKNLGKEDLINYKNDDTIKLEKKRVTIETIWKNTLHKHKLNQNDFIDLLINKGYIFRQKSKAGKKGSLTATSDGVKNGLMYMEKQQFTTSRGLTGYRHQLVFTAEGEKFITDYITKMYP